MSEEGYIKFNCHLTSAPPPDSTVIKDLLVWRQRLYLAGLIGMYPDGIGYGNISQRWLSEQFIISGTATGQLAKLTAAHFTKVIAFDPDHNQLYCEGPIRASSESMSHAILYRKCPEVQAVIHVHHEKIWERWLHQLPTSDPDAAYGSPEMVYAIESLLKNSSVRFNEKLFVMGGHREGLIAFGESLDEAGEALLKLLEGSD